MPRKLILSLALAACGAASGAACGETGSQIQQDIAERLQQGLTSTDKKRPEEPDRLPPELVINKLTLYVDCLNATRVPLYAGFRRASAAFAGHGKDVPEPVPPEFLDRCGKAERDGPLLQPKMPRLEQAIVAYHAGARALADTLDAVRADMSERSVQVREGEDSPLHTRLHAEFRAWDDARRALDEQIDARQDRLEAELLAQIEARAGKGLEWHSREAIMRARPYVRCLGDHDEFTAGVCERFHSEFRGAYDAFRAIYDADTRAAARVFWMPQFAGSLAEFAAVAETLDAALHEHRAQPGEIAAALREYADALHDSESLNFRRAS